MVKINKNMLTSSLLGGGQIIHTFVFIWKKEFKQLDSFSRV